MSANDRVVIVDPPLGFGRTECLDCGGRGERRLPAHVPHICHSCLFPSPVTDDPEADPPAFLPVVTLIEGLINRNLTIGRMHPGERRID